MYPGYAPGYPAQQTVQQTTQYSSSPAYPQPVGGYPGQPGYPAAPFPGQQPYGAPYQGQPYPGQPYPGQPYGAPAQPYPGQPYPGQPYGAPYGPTVQEQTTTTYATGGYAPPTAFAPAPVVTQTTTVAAFTPQVSASFRRGIQLWNLHGKFLVAGDYKPHGHHNPHHGFHHASHWHIEPHGAFTDKVSLRGKNGKYLCHEGHSSHTRMHHDPYHKDAAWHMEYFGPYVTFRSHGGHYLGCDSFGHDVHAWNEGPHNGQKFELRYV